MLDIKKAIIKTEKNALKSCVNHSLYLLFSDINKYPPAKPGVFQMRAKPYDTGSASRRITV